MEEWEEEWDPAWVEEWDPAWVEEWEGEVGEEVEGITETLCGPLAGTITCTCDL